MRLLRGVYLKYFIYRIKVISPKYQPQHTETVLPKNCIEFVGSIKLSRDNKFLSKVFIFRI